MWTLFCFFLLALQDHDKPAERAAPYYPTPQIVVDRMLKLGELKRGEKLYDLGSGDGRIVVLGAQKYSAKAAGVELDHALVMQSRERIAKLGLESGAKIIEATRAGSTGSLACPSMSPSSTARRLIRSTSSPRPSS